MRSRLGILSRRHSAMTSFHHNRLQRLLDKMHKERKRLLNLVKDGERYDIPNSSSDSPWTKEWDVIIEGSVYRVFEAMESLNGIDYRRPATLKEVQTARRNKKAKTNGR